MATSMNRTLVGVCDEEIPVSFITTWQCNKLGGQPDWMYPSSQHPVCIACGDIMYQVAQMYCPLEAVSYHRTIYIFTCIRITCLNRRESWRVFRCQIPVSSPPSMGSAQGMQAKPKEVAMATEEWCQDADDWGSGSEEENQSEDNGLSTTSQGVLQLNQKVPCQEIDFTEQGCIIAAPNQSDEGYSLRNSVAAVTHSSADAELTLCDEESIKSIENITGIVTGVRSCEEAPVQVQVCTEIINEKCNLSESGCLPPPLGPAFVEKPDHQTSDERVCDNTDPTDAMKKLSISVDNQTAAHMAIGFKGYFVCVFDEPLPSSAVTGLTGHERELMTEYQQREGVDLLEWQEQNLQRVSSGDESYEKMTAKHGDKIFASFAKRVQLCPEQCIRYSWNGSPIYQTSTSKGSIIPPCASCGGQLVFEFQLMPALINVLQDTNQSGAAVDFGVVIIYTCKASCWDDSSKSGQPLLREEYVVFEADPDSSLIAQATSLVESQST